MNQFLTKSETELLKILKKEINDANGSVCIQAGHFALINDTKSENVFPAIFEDIKDKKIKNAVKTHPYMGYLPLITWELGISLVKYGKETKKDVKILIIVNDWQWIKRAEKSEKNIYRDMFYEKAELPRSYKKELEKNGLTEEIILPFKDKNGGVVNRLFFSETKLRKQFERYYKATCPVSHGCAQEYVPMLSRLEKENIKTFISFVPRTCQIAVNEGSVNFKKSYKSGMRTVNIFVDGIFKKNFWEKVEVFVI